MWISGPLQLVDKPAGTGDVSSGQERDCYQPNVLRVPSDTTVNPFSEPIDLLSSSH